MVNLTIPKIFQHANIRQDCIGTASDEVEGLTSIKLSCRRNL